jgi:hypothetical protein
MPVPLPGTRYSLLALSFTSTRISTRNRDVDRFIGVESDDVLRCPSATFDSWSLSDRCTNPPPGAMHDARRTDAPASYLS